MPPLPGAAREYHEPRRCLAPWLCLGSYVSPMRASGPRAQICLQPACLVKAYAPTSTTESVPAQSALQRELVSGSTFKPWRKGGT
jgi:hypothetical protein